MKPKSEARATRRAIRKEIEQKVDAKHIQGRKLHRVRVKASGGIDGGCEGKNEVLRILDVSCVKWKDQSPNNIEKLRNAIDSEFEYVGTNLSEKGCKNAVTRKMRMERLKMKGWFLSGKKECPIFNESDQWARLCEYWSKPKYEKKAQRMANAHKQIKR